MIYYEDFEVGTVKTSGESYEVTRENIVAFASEWDPLPFHIDEKAASSSPVGQLFASGVQTVAIGIKLLRTIEKEEIAYVAGLGWEKYSLKAPVLPGYRLWLREEITDKRLSSSDPGRGIISTFGEIFNQDELVVADYLLSYMVLARP